MISLQQWLAAPLSELTSGADVEAMKLVVSTGAKEPALAKKALARLLPSRRHLVWRAAPKLKPELKSELLAICKKSKAIDARFYCAVAPKGLDALAAIWRRDGGSTMARALAKVSEAKDPAITRAALALIADTSTFAKGFATNEQGHWGMVALAMIAGGKGLEPLLDDKKLLAPWRTQLFEMAEAVQATKLIAKLKAASDESADSRASVAWAKSIGIKPAEAVWEVAIRVAARGHTGVYAPSFRIEVGGNEGEDWCVTVVHQDHGTATCLAGKMLANKPRFDALKSLADVPAWIARSETTFAVQWMFDKAKIKAPDGWKPKIATWLNSLARS